MKRLIASLQVRIHSLETRFLDRSLRERAILGGGLVALILLAFDVALIQPVEKERDRVERTISATQEEIVRIQGDLDALDRSELTPQELALLARRREAKEGLEAVTQEVANEVSDLVSPEAAVSLLEDMLLPFSELRLLRITSQFPHRVGSAALRGNDAETLEATRRLFRHGLVLELEGDFESTLDYIETVENSPWHILWDRFDYRVDRYPNARIRIELHTLSEQEEWIGV